MSVAVDTGVGVLDRVVAVLDAVEGGAGTFSEIVATTRLPRSTVHRLLRAMEAHGLITEPGDGAYRLGPRLLRLANAAADLPLRDLARPALEDLARHTGESAQLYVRARDARICVDTVESERELRTIVPVGASLPLTAGSAGKVFLAWAPSDRERDRLIAAAVPLTPSTPTGDRLRREVAAARRAGYASSGSERQEGVGSVSAPVLGTDGTLVAVVSVSGPSARLGRGGAAAYADAVIEAADAIGTALAGVSGA
ncbi:MAG: IclR family transcriptional regulator [Actinomycetota bacterium]